MSSNAVVHKSTPVLTVDRIEPAVQFWKKLGLMPTTAVPDTQANDGRLAFVFISSLCLSENSVEGDKLFVQKHVFGFAFQQVAHVVEQLLARTVLALLHFCRNLAAVSSMDSFV